MENAKQHAAQEELIRNGHLTQVAINALIGLSPAEIADLSKFIKPKTSDKTVSPLTPEEQQRYAVGCRSGSTLSVSSSAQHSPPQFASGEVVEGSAWHYVLELEK